MASYIILEPATLAERSRPDFSDRIRFVKSGFSLLGLILPVIWLLLHRLWWHAIVVFLLGIVCGYIGNLIGSVTAGTALAALLSLFVALEGKNWYLASLRRRGLVETAIIAAPTREEAEIRYFYSNQGINRSDDFTDVGQIKPSHSTTSSNAKDFVSPSGLMADEHRIGLVDYRGKI